MASEDLTSATDNVLGTLNAAWTDVATGARATLDALGGVALTADPVLLFEATERSLRPHQHPANGLAPWARVVVRHSDAVAAALGGHRFSRTGLAWVQVFVANVDGAAYSKAEALAKLAQKSYEGQRTGGVVFIKAIAKEVGQEAVWYRWDVLVTFNWTEIRP